MSIERKAIEVLAERGWNQGGLVGAGGRVCALGALSIACYGNPHLDTEGMTHSARTSAHQAMGEAWLQAADVVKEQFPERVVGVGTDLPLARFNDHPDTTLDDVILVLEKAAVRAEEVA
jgi:hypothetical protein